MRPENIINVTYTFSTDEKCYVRNGVSYRGTESRTVSGRICEPWSENQLYMRTADHPELIGGHNFCRNPGGSEVQPWCFVTTEHSVAKEACVVPMCSKDPPPHSLSM